MNPMRRIRIEKLTLNIGTGKDQNKLDKAVLLLKSLTGIEPVKTITNKRIPAWGVRPGLPLGCKLTLRKGAAEMLAKRLIEAKDKKLKPDCFDNSGNIAFGIHEYIDIPDIKYDPKIGIMGLQVCLTLERPGFRVKRRSVRQTKVGHKHAITKEEAIGFLQEAYGLTVGE
ncbi:50S ribosomal protein L5 [Candidatus Woesearchaeota archaeon]|nr:50S ribosomal protein L5 [Candidatus Woesearchaeota archaeon]